MRIHHRFVALVLAAPLLAFFPPAPATSSTPPAAAPLPPVLLHAIRETPAGDIGVGRPSALAWSPRLRALLVADGRRVVRLATSGRALGTVRLASTPRRSTLAVSRSSGATSYLAGSDLVTYPAGSLRHALPVGRRAALGLSVGQARGAAYDASGRLVVLDGTTLVRRGQHGRVVRTAVPALRGHDLVGMTSWPGRNVLFTYDRGTRMLVGIRHDGVVVRRFDLRRVHAAAVTGLAIAPSADHTDHRSTKSLYLADAGSGARQGRIVEVSLATAVPAAAAAAVPGSLVRTVLTSSYSPPSPDPSGIGYLPDLDRFILSDGEVDEMTIFAGVNLFETTRNGTQTRNGVSQPWSNEPTGVGYNPVNHHLLVSDDSKREIYDVAAGPDTRYGSSDDIITHFDTLGAGNDDPEDVTYDPVTNSIWTIDGLNTQVFRYRPGPDGTFGTADDIRSNFDLGVYGAGDPEGIDFDSVRDTLVVVDDPSNTIYELDRTGALLNTISTTAAGMRAAAGIAVAPGSADPNARHYYVVARGIDNDNHPDENDGKLYELAATLPPVGPEANESPVVSAGPDLTVTLPATGSVSANLDGTVTDDGRPIPPGATTATWSKVSGFGNVVFANPNAVDTTASFSAAGTYVLRLSASDGQATGGDDVTVTVRPPTGGGVVTVETIVQAGSDDAEQGPSGGMDLASTDLELVVDGTKVQRVGVRFANLQVPAGATISRAWVQFQTDEVSTDAATLTVRADAADNTPTYVATNSNVSNRPATTVSVPWSPPAWNTVGARTAAQQTPDLSSLVQAVVSRPGWAQGNALAFQLSGTGRRTAEAFEGNFAPLLHVEYSTGSPASNQPPSVSAGADETVTMPATGPASASLNGTVSDDGLPNPPGATTPTWSKVSGPGTVAFGNPNAVDTTATFSAAGTYVLRLSVTDSALTATDDLTVVVNPPSPTNAPPSVSAGIDQAVTLPSSASLDGTVSDDGLPNPPGATTPTWSKVSGPGTVTFGNPNAVDTTATFSAAGTYVLRLSVTDSALTATDDLTVVANPATPTNAPPSVSAGIDQAVTLPSSASLDGTVSDDGLPNPPGATTPTWSKVSGPGTVTFGNPNAVDTTATFSAAGTYVLRLSVTDSALTATDEVSVVVGSGTPGALGLIDGIEPEGQGSVGPWVDGNGNLYRVTEEYLAAGNHPMMMKSTDGGVTWVRRSTGQILTGGAHNDLESFWGVQRGTSIYFVFQKSGSNRRVFSGVFNTSDHATGPDTFHDQVVVTSPTAAPGDQNVSMSVLSDGTLWMFYRTAPAGGVEKIGYRKSTNGGASWGAEAVLPDTVSVTATSPVVTGSTVYLFYKGGNQVLMRTLAANGTLSAATRVDSGGTSTHAVPLTTAVRHVSGGSDVLTIGFTNAAGILKSVSVSNGTVGPEQTISPSAVTVSPGSTTSESSHATLAVDAATGTLHALWSRASDGNLMHARKPPGGSWTTPQVLWESGADAAWWTYGAVLQRAGRLVLAYTYDQGPHVDDDSNIRYAELDLQPTGNTAPSVSAGSDQTVTTPTTGPASANLDGTVSDDGLPNPPGATSVTWSKVSGPGTVTFGNPGAVDTSATFGTDGSYVLRLSVTDSALSATDEVTVTVRPAGGGGVTTFETSVALGSDDAEQSPTGGVDLTSSDLELVTDGTKVQRVGLRFANLQVPVGATITRAWIQFQTDEVSTDVATLTLRAEAADNAPTYLTTNSNLSNRALASASVAWSPPVWNIANARTAAQQTPDIAALVQAIVSRPGWARGNALAVQITGTGRRTAEASEGTFAPLLHVEWQP